MRALAIAATGMNAQQLNVEVIANNIANINTTAFKRARAEFTDLLYQPERPAGVPNRGNQNPIPEGAQVGLGVRNAAIRNLHIQGALTSTNNKLDVAINGRGWFQIEGENGETFYTRAGTFNKNAEGQIVTIDGNPLMPQMTVPQDTTEIVINKTGEVFARIGTQVDMQSLGQITLANFANDAGLEPMGGNLYRETVASGQPVEGVPGEDGLGTLKQGVLEGSNVQVVEAMVNMIAIQRAYEANAKVLDAASGMQQFLNQTV